MFQNGLWPTYNHIIYLSILKNPFSEELEYIIPGGFMIAQPEKYQQATD